jgi:DNA-binding CsgD family transcriptional regulator
VILVRQAKANKEIAYELCLTEGTVKEYLNRIFKKLQVRNRTELAVRGLNLVDAAVASTVVHTNSAHHRSDLPA